MGLTSCCRCLDLRQGSQAIGIFYVVVSALGTLLSIIFLAVGPQILTRPLLSRIDMDTLISLIRIMPIILWIG